MTAGKALKGGETGPAIVPGKPDQSLLIEAIRYTNDDMKMPPKSRLAANVVADLTTWVRAGSPWPQQPGAIAAKPLTNAPPTGPTANYDRLRKEHWAWQPLKDSPAPSVKDMAWPHNDIDRFILAKLEEKGLSPVADADRAALIRRVTFDLTGLPPTPDEIGSFLADRSTDAYEKLVDRLLASSAYGERWGRHWLDVARYAESTGSSRNVPYNFAWRYRDYVVDAFNKDKPFDRFIAEQIAGDLLPYRTADEHNEQMIATGFLAVGVKDLNERDRLKYVMDNVDEQIDVTTRSIMALTVSCARCHDHKFDPIPTADYYSLAGIFKSTDIMAGVHGRNKGGGGKDYAAPERLLHLDGVTPEPVVVAAAAPVATPVGPSPKKERLEARAEALREELQKLRKDGKTAHVAERKAKRQELLAIMAELGSEPSQAAPSAPVPGNVAVMGARDSAHPADCAICLHGEPHDLGQSVPRGFVSVVPVHSVTTPDASHSGRLELAQWLTALDNPLTPRVMVNRIWAHLFGEGIVRTVDNFGTTGESPVNPKLLDHLATDFVRHGWSVKSMVRQMVLSHAYQLSSVNNPKDFSLDPGDRLVWRMPQRRLDAEEIRDAMLAIGGKLDHARQVGSPAAGLPIAELRVGKRGFQPLGDSDHRSVYLPILRDLVPPVLDLFDFAEPTMVIGSRDTTTVPTQALFLMNDPFVTDSAHRMADRLQTATGMDDPARVDLAYRLALGRSASATEKARALRYVNEFQHDAMMSTKDSVKGSRSDAWASFCQILMGCASSGI